MKIRVKRYLRTSEISRIGEEILLGLGFLEQTGFKLYITDFIFELLSLADGSDIDKIYKSLLIKYPYVEKDHFFGVVQELIKSGVLENVDLWKKNVQFDKMRYDRHLVFYSMFNENPIEVQELLRKKRVALIGVGGIGSWVGQLLTAAGIGELVLVDDDRIELSNLTRQTLFDTSVIGEFKAYVAAERLKKINPETILTPIIKAINSVEDALMCINKTDFVILSADTPGDIHEWMESACIELNTPYSPTGYVEYYGFVGPIVVPGQTPCYDCRRSSSTYLEDTEFKEQVDNIDSRFQPPSFGPINAVVASIQSGEAIKFLTGIFQASTLHKRLSINFMNWETEYKEYRKRTHCNCVTNVEVSN